MDHRAAETLKKRLDEIYWELRWPSNIKRIKVNSEKSKLSVEIEMKSTEEWFWTKINVVKLKNALEQYYYRVYWMQCFPSQKRVLLHLKEKVKKRNLPFFLSKKQMNRKYRLNQK